MYFIYIFNIYKYKYITIYIFKNYVLINSHGSQFGHKRLYDEDLPPVPALPRLIPSPRKSRRSNQCHCTLCCPSKCAFAPGRACEAAVWGVDGRVPASGPSVGRPASFTAARWPFPLLQPGSSACSTLWQVDLLEPAHSGLLSQSNTICKSSLIALQPMVAEVQQPVPPGSPSDSARSL